MDANTGAVGGWDADSLISALAHSIMQPQPPPPFIHSHMQTHSPGYPFEPQAAVAQGPPFPLPSASFGGTAEPVPLSQPPPPQPSAPSPSQTSESKVARGSDDVLSVRAHMALLASLLEPLEPAARNTMLEGMAQELSALVEANQADMRRARDETAREQLALSALIEETTAPRPALPRWLAAMAAGIGESAAADIGSSADAIAAAALSTHFGAAPRTSINTHRIDKATATMLRQWMRAHPGEHPSPQQLQRFADSSMNRLEDIESWFWFRSGMALPTPAGEHPSAAAAAAAPASVVAQPLTSIPTAAIPVVSSKRTRAARARRKARDGSDEEPAAAASDEDYVEPALIKKKQKVTASLEGSSREADRSSLARAPRSSRVPTLVGMVLRQYFMCLVNSPYLNDHVKKHIALKTRFPPDSITDWFADVRKTRFGPYRSILLRHNCSLLVEPFQPCTCPGEGFPIAGLAPAYQKPLPVHYWARIFEGQLTSLEQYPVVPHRGLGAANKLTEALVKQIQAICDNPRIELPLPDEHDQAMASSLAGLSSAAAIDYAPSDGPDEAEALDPPDPDLEDKTEEEPLSQWGTQA